LPPTSPTPVERALAPAMKPGRSNAVVIGALAMSAIFF
jgi:hypothetical protein